MIPTYLKSLAATVRDLVASGNAVHVTNETAAELDLLAGLPWNQAPLLILKERMTAPARPITPADLALGWLLASRAVVSADEDGAWNNTLRAAECAELAVIAARLCPEIRPVEPELSAERVAEIRAMLAALQGAPVIKPMEMQAVGIDPHDGTREGARAAWGFVVEQLTRSADSIEENTRKPDANIDRFVGRRLLCADRYRRELEAM